MTVTFIGHADTPQSVKKDLKREIIYLIEQKNANLFYVGKHGNFDSMVIKCLYELKDIYSHIKYFIAVGVSAK